MFFQQSTSMSSYPVHRSLPPTRRSGSDENLVPGEVWNKPLNPHANLSPLRATRLASNEREGLGGRGKIPLKSVVRTGDGRGADHAA